MPLDQRIIGIVGAVLGAIVLVAILEAGIATVRQALILNRRIGRLAGQALPFDADLLERDVARLTGLLPASQQLAMRVEAARQTIALARSEWLGTGQRIATLRDRAKALPQTLDQPL